MSMVPISKLKIKKDVIEMGNPDLKPSRAISADLGVSYFINEFSYISARVYHKWVRDMIELKYTGIDPLTGITFILLLILILLQCMASISIQE